METKRAERNLAARHDKGHEATEWALWGEATFGQRR